MLKEYASEIETKDPHLLDSICHDERVELIRELKNAGHSVAIYTDNHGQLANLLISAVEKRAGVRFNWVKTGDAKPGETKMKNLYEIEELFCNGEPTRIIMYDDRPKDLIKFNEDRHRVMRVSPRFRKHTDPVLFAEHAGITLTSELLDKCNQYYEQEQKRWASENQ